MKNLSTKEALEILNDMKVKNEIPKAAETQRKRNAAIDLAIEVLKCSEIPNCSDAISRQAVRLIESDSDAYPQEWNNDYEVGFTDALNKVLALPSVQPEPSKMTDEQAILHLQSTGWMQNHDREMYESGLREQLADDSGGYDSLIPCEDTISRQAAIDAVRHAWAKGLEPSQYIEDLPPVQPEERTEERTKTHACDYACDCISRQDAIDALDKHLRTTDVPVSYPGIISALTEWLNELPSAQADSKETSSTHKALDTISRQAVIEAINKIFPADPMRDDYTQGITCGAALANIYVAQLPSAQPETHEERTETHACDLISRQAAIDAVDKLSDKPIGYLESAIDVLVDLLSVQPERKTGQWILADTYDGRKRYRCSECLAFALKTDDGQENLSDYCPVCGAEMKGETDEQRTGN